MASAIFSAVIIVEAEVPGMDEKDVSVTLTDRVLTIKRERKSEREEKNDNYHLMERDYGSFHRSFQVDDSVDADNVKADFEKGVLRVTMPKRPEATRAPSRPFGFHSSPVTLNDLAGTDPPSGLFCM